MSIFSVIKYPVNINFTVEHLEALPKPVLRRFWNVARTCYHHWENRARIPCEPHRISIYLNNSTPKIVRTLLLIRLHRMIQELDE